jgi:hypothetical protein
LYDAAGNNYSADFNDITSGNNGNYDAGVGYDMATGLGSPVGAALATSLCGDSVYVANPGTQTYTEGTAITPLTIDSGGPSALTVKTKGLPAGLTFAGGQISGTPTHAGFFPVVISASDSDNVAAQAKFTIDVVSTAPPTVSASLRAPHGAHAKLVATIKAPGGTTLKTVTLHLPSSVSLGGSKAQLKREVSVRFNGGKGTFVLQKHTVTFTCSGTNSVTLTARAPSLRLTAALDKAIRNGHRRALAFATNVRDSASSSFRLPFSVRVG